MLTTGSRSQREREAARLVTPWGIEWWLYVRRHDKALRRFEATRPEALPSGSTRVEEAIRFLVDRGLDEHEVREGSVPEHSLDYVAEIIFDHLPSDRPVRALHVGNFVGVSLCYFSGLVRDRHPESVMVSIDPNIPHREIGNPQAHVLALLHRFGLLGHNLIIPGYTLEENLWGGSAEDVDAAYLEGLACENVLSSLQRLAGRCFDLVVLDGNHDDSYLSREFRALRGLLADDSIVVFDDVTEWEGVVEVFAQALEDEAFVKLGEDGRSGILQVRGR